MTRGDGERLDDIAEAIAAIRGHSASGAADSTRRDAILYNLLIIGEAVKRMTEASKAREPGIAWKRIAGLRDLLAHEYFKVEPEEIDRIVKGELEPLARAIAALRRRR